MKDVHSDENSWEWQGSGHLGPPNGNSGLVEDLTSDSRQHDLAPFLVLGVTMIAVLEVDKLRKNTTRRKHLFDDRIGDVYVLAGFGEVQDKYCMNEKRR